MKTQRLSKFNKLQNDTKLGKNQVEINKGKVVFETQDLLTPKSANFVKSKKSNFCKNKQPIGANKNVSNKYDVVNEVCRLWMGFNNPQKEKTDPSISEALSPNISRIELIAGLEEKIIVSGSIHEMVGRLGAMNYGEREFRDSGLGVITKRLLHGMESILFIKHIWYMQKIEKLTYSQLKAWKLKSLTV